MGRRWSFAVVLALAVSGAASRAVAQPHEPFGFLRVTEGATVHEPTGIAGPSFALDLGGRPMAGALVATGQASVFFGGERLIVVTVGVGVELDLSHWIDLAWAALSGGEPDPNRFLQLAVGTRLGLSYGRDQQDAPVPTPSGQLGTQRVVYESLRPEWCIYVEPRGRIERLTWLTARFAFDLPFDGEPLSRLTFALGVVYEW